MADQLQPHAVMIQLDDGVIEFTRRPWGTDVLIYDDAGLECSMIDHVDELEAQALIAKYPRGDEGTYWSDIVSGPITIGALADLFDHACRTVADAVDLLNKITAKRLADFRV